MFLRSFFLTFFFLHATNLSLQAQKLFTKLDSKSTGIEFNNVIVDSKETSILLYSNFYGGAGVGIADLDNDGLQDIYFPGNLVHDKLYKNLGNLKFQDVTKSAGILEDDSWSSSVLFGDVNNDGLLDIYVTCELYDDNREIRKNKLYINKGDFVFENQAEGYGLADSERSRGATFIDYDKDGWLDLFVLNQPPNPGNYSAFSGQDLLKPEYRSRLYKNNGFGYFDEVGIQAGVGMPSYPNSVIAADINNDGWQDLYVSNDYEAPDFYYVNNQDGTFSNIIDTAMQHISYYAMGVDASDINNDGLLDVMTLDMVAEDNYRLKRNMSGMQPKLFWKLVSQGAHYQYMFNALHLNQGHDLFGDIAQMAGVSSTDWSWSNVIADFDNDGWKDIYITNGLLKDIRNTDMEKVFTKFVEKSIQDYLAENPNAGEVDIFDVLDVKKGMDLHPSVPLNNYAYKNKGDLQFENQTADWGLDDPSFSNGCAYADLDNDGDLDLVVSNINEEAFVFQNNASSNFLRVKILSEFNVPTQGTKISLFSDGDMQYSEMVSSRGMYSSSENIFHFGLANKAKVDSIIIQWPNGNVTKRYDLESNQEVDLVLEKAEKKPANNKHKNAVFSEISMLKSKLDFVHHENDFYDYDKQVLLPHEMSHQGPAASVGDINNDGLDDVFVGGAHGQMSELYLQTSNGSFIKGIHDFDNGVQYEDVASVFFDADNDGDLDLYVVSGGNAFPQRNKMYLDRLYINDGQGGLYSAPDRIPRILESGSCVVPFDYDGDGDLDLFVGGRHQPWDYPSPSISRLLQNDDGVFIDVTKELAKDLINIGMVTDALASDYNGDGKEDLILVGEWMPITFLKNIGQGFSIDQVNISKNGDEVATNGWWNSIYEKDLDNNGKMDYVLGNLGLNYKYKATQAEPFTVHYDDFDKNGSKDIVLSYYNFGEQFPLRGRSCSAEQIPNLKKDFPSYDIFAETDLEGVYGSEALDEALEYQAYMFESVALFAEAGKNFRIESLPNIAQTSCINSIAEIDIDNDGFAELITAGNMYQAEIETPRNDASTGTLLKFVDGDWIAQSNVATRLNLAYDVREVIPIVIGEEECLLVVSNNDKVMILKKDR